MKTGLKAPFWGFLFPYNPGMLPSKLQETGILSLKKA
jgi:hypothetical protein